MGSFGVVVGSPFFDSLPGIGQRDKPGSVQALRTQWSIKRFDKSVVRRFSRPREVEFNLVQICPLVERPVDKFRPVVGQNTSRLAADPRKAIQFFDHLVRPESCSRACRESSSRIAVDDRQDPERPPVMSAVRDEVVGPDVVWV